MTGELSPREDGIPVVADAATREIRFPLATRAQDQRVYNKATRNIERWSGSAWVIDFSGTPLTPITVTVATPADNATDIGPGLTAAIAALGTFMGGTVIIPPGQYYAATTAVIPLAYTGSARVVIRGYGATIRTDQAIPILSRMPLNLTDEGNGLGSAVIVRGVQFTGTALTGQIGLQIGASYTSVVEDCQFTSLDIGLDLQSTLNTRVASSMATNCKTYGFVARLGTWTGANGSNAQSNHTTFKNCRNYAAAGMTAGFYVQASDGVHLLDCITEGGNPVNNVLFDANGSTTTKNFRVTNLHCENTPTGAHIRLIDNGGMTTIDGLWTQTASVFIDDSGSNDGGSVVVENIPFFPPGSQFKHGSSGSAFGWTFQGAVSGSEGIDVTAASNWVGGIVPTTLVSMQGTPNGGWRFRGIRPSLYGAITGLFSRNRAAPDLNFDNNLTLENQTGSYSTVVFTFATAVKAGLMAFATGGLAAFTGVAAGAFSWYNNSGLSDANHLGRLDANGLQVGGAQVSATEKFDLYGNARIRGKLRILEGANQYQGVATLVAGTVTVANTSVTATSRLFLSRATAGGTLGHLSFSVVAGTSFTITSSSGTDTSSIAWLITEPG